MNKSMFRSDEDRRPVLGDAYIHAPCNAFLGRRMYAFNCSPHTTYPNQPPGPDPRQKPGGFIL